jgi:hypothetical protein
MKQLTWKLILPLTVISFTVLTKWWYVLPVDAPDSMMLGFPLPYVCDGWGTSMSLQIFFFELLIDLLTYFSLWFVIVFCIDKFIFKIKLHKIVTILLLTTGGLFTCSLTYIASFHENLFYAKRNFDIDVLVTGYKFMWEGNTRPANFDFDEYYKRKNK